MKIAKHHSLLILLAILAGGFFAFSRLPAKNVFTLPEVKHEPKITTIFFGGDIMLSRNVAAKIYAANDFTLPFKGVVDRISKTDIAFANLESPFNDHDNHSVEGSLIFNADPKSVEGLKLAGFDILSTANNHALDQGKIGIDYTLQTLKDQGIKPIGTGLDCHEGQIVERDDIKFGFLAYSYTALNDGGKTIDPAVCDFNNLKQMSNDIQKLKLVADIVIVNMHAGTEYIRKPTQAQIDFAHAAIDSGAELVVGEHPHWIQTTEQYQGKWILYSLGNFVFDQMWSQQTREGLTAMITFKEKNIEKIELQPVIIDNFCCPRWTTDDETKTILEKIDLTSPILFQHN